MKNYEHLVGSIVVFEGDYLKVVSVYDEGGELLYELSDWQVVNSWDCSDTSSMVGEEAISELADLIWEDEDVAEDMIYEMGYSLA